jgi:hypothetical protein
VVAKCVSVAYSAAVKQRRVVPLHAVGESVENAPEESGGSRRVERHWFVLVVVGRRVSFLVVSLAVDAWVRFPVPPTVEAGAVAVVKCKLGIIGRWPPRNSEGGVLNRARWRETLRRVEFSVKFPEPAVWRSDRVLDGRVAFEFAPQFA